MFDDMPELTGMSTSSPYRAFKSFTKNFSMCFYDVYTPEGAELQEIMAVYSKMGLDADYRIRCTGKEGFLTLAYSVVVGHNKKIHHSTRSIFDSRNDKTMSKVILSSSATVVTTTAGQWFLWSRKEGSNTAKNGEVQSLVQVIIGVGVVSNVDSGRRDSERLTNLEAHEFGDSRSKSKPLNRTTKMNQQEQLIGEELDAQLYAIVLQAQTPPAAEQQMAAQLLAVELQRTQLQAVELQRTRRLEQDLLAEQLQAVQQQPGVAHGPVHAAPTRQLARQQQPVDRWQAYDKAVRRQADATDVGWQADAEAVRRQADANAARVLALAQMHMQGLLIEELRVQIGELEQEQIRQELITEGLGQKGVAGTVAGGVAGA
ncbi:hypothetical protein B484DRAFT_404594, partial [Ochromonadaceae sp. CCMP2298]